VLAQHRSAAGDSRHDEIDLRRGREQGVDVVARQRHRAVVLPVMMMDRATAALIRGNVHVRAARGEQFNRHPVHAIVDDAADAAAQKAYRRLWTLSARTHEIRQFVWPEGPARWEHLAHLAERWREKVKEPDGFEQA